MGMFDVRGHSDGAPKKGGTVISKPDVMRTLHVSRTMIGGLFIDGMTAYSISES